MEDFTVRQGGVVAKLSQLDYRPDEDFQEGNTWRLHPAPMEGVRSLVLE
jgi:hypothetical protein